MILKATVSPLGRAAYADSLREPAAAQHLGPTIHEESDPIYEAMKRILTDDQLREKLIRQERADVQQFGVEVMIRAG